MKRRRGRRPIRATDGTQQCRGSERGLLTPDQVKVAKAALEQGQPQAEVARLLGISVDTLRARLRDQLASVTKSHHRTVSLRRGSDPTPEEIYGRLVLIEQAGWTDEEREQRWRGWFKPSAEDA